MSEKVRGDGASQYITDLGAEKRGWTRKKQRPIYKSAFIRENPRPKSKFAIREKEEWHATNHFGFRIV